MINKAAFIWSKLFKMSFIPVMAKLNFQQHYSSFQSHMIHFIQDSFMNWKFKITALIEIEIFVAL